MQISSHTFENSPKPTPYEYVIAKTRQARYISYVDDAGRWFRVADDTLIEDVIHWYPLYANSCSSGAN